MSSVVDEWYREPVHRTNGRNKMHKRKGNHPSEWAQFLRHVYAVGEREVGKWGGWDSQGWRWNGSGFRL